MYFFFYFLPWSLCVCVLFSVFWKRHEAWLGVAWPLIDNEPSSTGEKAATNAVIIDWVSRLENDQAKPLTLIDTEKVKRERETDRQTDNIYGLSLSLYVSLFHLFRQPKKKIPI